MVLTRIGHLGNFVAVVTIPCDSQREKPKKKDAKIITIDAQHEQERTGVG
jgi:hypothetical protein